MRYARLGDSGLIVSRLAVGAMTFGDSWKGALAGMGEDQVTRLVGRALDGGVNFFDVADVYHAGQSEMMLGKALGERRGEAVIATKVGMRMGPRLDLAGLSARHIHASVDGSLTRLGTDWIDVYICHRPDPLTPLAETLQALDGLVRSGKVRYLGFSNWPAWLAAKAIEMQKANGWARFVTGQMYYSLVARDIEQEYVPMAQDAGVGTMVWSPLSSGFLSGKYTREDPTGGKGRLSAMDIIPFDREHGYDIVDAVRAIAEARGVAPSAVALAWVAARPSVSTVILGMTSDAQFEQNMSAADLVLADEETATLDAVSQRPLAYPASFLARFDKDPAAAALR